MSNNEELDDDFSDDEEKKPNNPELEQEFLAAREKATKLIDEQLTLARKAIQKAERISQKYGVPFSSDVSPLGQSYTPMSYYDKFGELDYEALCEKDDELYNTYPGGQYGGDGWEHSAVC